MHAAIQSELLPLAALVCFRAFLIMAVFSSHSARSEAAAEYPLQPHLSEASLYKATDSAAVQNSLAQPRFRAGACGVSERDFPLVFFRMFTRTKKHIVIDHESEGLLFTRYELHHAQRSHN